MSENQIYGIDLGTTYSCIAYVDEHGKPVVVPNSDNDSTTPSVVYFESSDNTVVGKSAKSVAEIYPSDCVTSVKRVMGDREWEFVYEDQSYSAQEISSYILRKVVADAEAISGHEIKDVVITVPAYFGVNQKEATKQAGILADLNVLYVIPEPTAAAIAYGMEKTEEQVVLVYDLGGGTFDVTVVEIKDGSITVVCTGGDHQLGGQDWDEAIASYFAESFAAEKGVEAEELMDDPETWQELLNTAEEVKKNLSIREKVTQRVSYDGDRATVELTREKLEEITQALLLRTINLTEELITTASAKGYDNIDTILLVGGSSYMPMVMNALKGRFSDDIKLFDPNQSVARGAALFGYKFFLDEQIKIAVGDELGVDPESVDMDAIDEESRDRAQQKVANEQGMDPEGLSKLAKTNLNNVTSKSFGVVVVDENDELKVTNLIQMNDPVPQDVTKSFQTHYADQDGVFIQCIESQRCTESGEKFEFDQSQEIGSATLAFERPLSQGSPIEITFALAPDGLLSVRGKDLTTNGEIFAEFETESVLTQAEMAEKLKRARAISVSS